MPPESETAPISVLLADNNEKVRIAIRHLLQSDPEIPARGGSAELPRNNVDLARKLRPRVVVMDLHMQEMRMR